MGRPREHGDRTAASLLAAAEEAVQEHGPDALSVRGVAREAGTTTRAVYSLFGSKDGLLAALAAHAFDLLAEGLEELPLTADPETDLVDAGLVFRRFAVEHPSLFKIAFQRDPMPMIRVDSVRSSAYAALGVLTERVARLTPIGMRVSPGDAALAFHAVCEGLAGLELRGTFRDGSAERHWREGLAAVVRGLVDDAQP